MEGEKGASKGAHKISVANVTAIKLRKLRKLQDTKALPSG